MVKLESTTSLLQLSHIDGNIAYVEINYSGQMADKLKRQLEDGIEFQPVARVHLNEDKSIKYMMGIDLHPMTQPIL